MGSMKKIIIYTYWLLLILVVNLLILHENECFSFCIENRSSYKIKTWVEPGNFKKEIWPKGKEGCDWTNRSCNPDTKRAYVQRLSVQCWDSEQHYVAVLPMQAGGYAIVKEENRSRIGVPKKNMYVEVYDVNGMKQITSPYGVGKRKRNVKFLVTADPQFFDYYNSKKHMGKNNEVMESMLNDIKESCTVKKPMGDCEIRGMIIAGDLTQKAKKVEMSWYLERGIRENTRFVYDGYGNHDCVYRTGFDGQSIQKYLLLERLRDTVASHAEYGKGPHYSWDWHDVHFVQLNLFAGNEPPKTSKHKNNNDDPRGSLAFLVDDLKKNVLRSKNKHRPVILIQHYGFDTESLEWWTDEERRSFWNAIADYNVKAIFTGHIHLERGDKAQEKWNIQWKRPSGIEMGPKYIETFVAGAAFNGVYLDVSIEDSYMTVTRMFKEKGKPKEKQKKVSVSMAVEGSPGT